MLSFDELSLVELVENQKAIEQEIRARTKTELAALETRRTELLAILGREPIEDVNLYPVEKLKVVKYRDPLSGKTWTGKGKRPGWFDATRADEYCLAG